jgi:hypothetical protein
MIPNSPEVNLMAVPQQLASSPRQPRYSKEEFAQRGNEIYETQIRSQVEAENHGKIVVIDIDTAAYEIAEDSLTAAKQLLKCYPDAQIYGLRIGHRGIYNFGFHAPTVSS